MTGTMPTGWWAKSDETMIAHVGTFVEEVSALSSAGKLVDHFKRILAMADLDPTGAAELARQSFTVIEGWGK